MTRIADRLWLLAAVWTVTLFESSRRLSAAEVCNPEWVEL